MKVFRNAFAAGRWAPASVAAIGKFDGMHLGHQKVLRLAVRRARALKTRSLAVTFDPHPREFFDPGSYRPMLTLEDRLGLMGALGVDAALVLPFNRKLTCQAPEAFARDVLAGALRLMAVYVGSDFCYGKDRAGNVGTLKAMGRELGFTVHAVPLTRVNGEKLSATMIRRLLDEGRPNEAARCLGRRPDPTRRRA